MNRFTVGDSVIFQSNTGQALMGTVVELITERRQPTMILIERHDGGRAIRLENEVQPYEVPVRRAG